MRHPFYSDYLDPKDRKAIGRLHAGVVATYLFLLLGLMFAVKLHAPNVQILAAESETAAPRRNPLADAFSAVAAERADTVQCASRDLKLVISLADHGEAQDVPPATLNAAFLALVKARAACAAGRVDEALSIYDGIVIAPEQSAKK